MKSEKSKSEEGWRVEGVQSLVRFMLHVHMLLMLSFAGTNAEM
jgi:hypothetical protein